MPHKLGIYIRVSTEEQAQVVEGSIQSQEHRLRGYIDLKNHQETGWGKLVESYIDDGFSAKDTRRPAYQRMLRDLRQGKISLILVTDLSRLSRSISDFCGLLEELNAHKAKFLSIKEQFDTTTAAGEMMIFNMINLAQFERKQTAERISMNFHSRALRGLANGGAPILGFDKDPTNPGKLVVNEDEAVHVRRIMELYLGKGSLQATVRALNDLKIPRKATARKRDRHIEMNRWTMNGLYNVLRNPAYIGLREINRRNKDEDPTVLKSWEHHQLVKASWKGFVDEEIFSQVQKALEDAHRRERHRLKSAEKRVFLLSGILRCGECGRALIGQSSHGKNQVHRYYGHKSGVDEVLKCKIKRFRANEIEEAVINHLDEVMLRSGYLDQLEDTLRNITRGSANLDLSEKTRVEKQLKAIESEIESVFRLFSEMGTDSSAGALVREQLDKLAERRRLLAKTLESLRTSTEGSVDAKMARNVIEGNVKAFRAGWKKSGALIQKRLLRRVVQRLVYTTDGLKTYFVLAPHRAMEIQIQNKNGTPGSNPGVPLYALKRPTVFLLDGNASSFCNGGPDRDRTCDLHNAIVALSQLSYWPSKRQNHSIRQSAGAVDVASPEVSKLFAPFPPKLSRPRVAPGTAISACKDTV